MEMHHFLLDHISMCAWCYSRIWIEGLESVRHKHELLVIRAKRKALAEFRWAPTLHVNRWQSLFFCVLVVSRCMLSQTHRKTFVCLFDKCLCFFPTCVWFEQCENFSLNFSSKTILSSTLFRMESLTKNMLP